jgi:biotin carboxyl carrier protein
MKLKLVGDAREFEVEIRAQEGSLIRATINGEEAIAQVERTAGATVLRFDGHSVGVFMAKRRDSILVAAGPSQFEFIPLEATGRRRAHGLAAHEITAPMPGKVLKILVSEQQKVDAGTPLLTLEAMKMETTLYAEEPALIGKIRVSPSQMVDHGALLMELSPPASAAPSTREPGFLTD